MSLEMSFALSWSEAVQRQTLKFIKVRTKIDKDKFISINLLEFVCIILLYTAVTQKVRDGYCININVYPSLLMFSDNTSAISWTKKAAISTKPG